MKTGKLYLDLYQKIRSGIISGKFAFEEKLPSENEICSKYSVSRITANRVFKMLETDRLIVRHQGKGSFVSFRAGNVAGKGDAIAFVTQTLKYVHPLVEELSRLLDREGVSLRLLVCEYDRKAEFAAFDDPRYKRVVFNPSWLTHDILNVYPGVLSPYADKAIVIAKKIEGFGGFDIYPNEVEISRELVRFFQSINRNRIGYFTIYPDFHYHGLRQKGFMEETGARGLHGSTLTGTLGMGDAAAIKKWIEKEKLNALITDQPEVASQTIHAMNAMGFRVPEDMAVAVFADHGTAALQSPTVTYMDRPWKEMASIIRDIVTGRGDHPREIVVKTDIVEHSSTGALSAHAETGRAEPSAA